MAFMFPWSNFHELNLDWILSVVKEAKDIFVRGEGDIQHAVETADQALETAEQAAAGVIADGAVTIPKVNDEVFNLMAYIVSGSVNPVAISSGSLVILRKSTVYGANDGIYVAAADIPASSVLTAADLLQPSPLPDAGGLNYVLSVLGSEIDDTVTSINAIERGLVIVVDGNNATSAVPVGGLAYLKNNANGLQEGIYANVSNAPYPTTGGTADNTVFNAVTDVLNSLKANLNQLEDTVDTKAAKADIINLFRTGTSNTGSPIAAGRFFYLNDVVVRAIAEIASGSAFTENTNYQVVPSGAVSNLNDSLLPVTLQSGLNSLGNMICTGYISGSGNYAVAYIPVMNLFNKTITSVVIDSGSSVFQPDARVNFSTQVTASSVPYDSQFGVIAEFALPSTQTPNCNMTMYALGIKIYCT